jgi:tetratricopeptide (TPR) repeat protein
VRERRAKNRLSASTSPQGCRHGLRAVVFCLFLLVAGVFTAGQTKSPPKRTVSQPANHDPGAASGNPVNKAPLQELQKRYEALGVSKASGSIDTVIDASKQLAALALRQLAALRLLQQLYPQAVEGYRKSLEMEDVPGARLNLALAALGAGEPGEALAQTANLLASDPNNPRLWYLQGKAQMAKEDYQGAVESFERCLQLGPEVNAQYALGSSLLKLKQKEKAETVFQKMLSSYGDKAIWHVVFAGAYREAKYPEDAIREFRLAIQMDPKASRAQFFLGLTLLEQNHWAQSDESMAAFRAAVATDPQDYFPNFYLGAGESELKLFESSNKHLKVALETHPEVPEIWLYLGLNQFQLQDYSQAKKHLLKAVELTGKDEAQNNFQIRRAYIALGRMEFIAGNTFEAEHWTKRARDLQNKSLANSAESIAETMAAGGMQHAAGVMPQVKIPAPQPAANTGMDASVPGNTDDLRGRGRPRSMNRKEEADAKQYETKLREVLSSSLNDWGTAEARQGDYKQALEHFHEAEKWDKTTPGLMRNAGVAALKVEDIPEALRALNIAVEVDPKDEAARARLALTLFRTDEYADAVKQFEALGAGAANDPGLAYAWSYSLVRLNQGPKASELLGRITPQVSSAELLVSIGDLYSVLEDYEHAVGAYRKAIELDANFPRARYKMGAALLRLDRPEAAIPALQEEIKITPNDPDVQYNLAYALLQTSQKEQAMAMLQTVLQAHPEHAEAQYQMGKVLLDEGKMQDAVEHLEAAARLDPEKDYIHYQLQTAYRKAGRKNDADRELAVYREIKNKKREKAAIPQAEHAQ